MQQLLSGEKGLKGFEKQKWEKKSLSDVCLSIVSGGTPDTKIPDYWDGSIPWITGADFEDQKIGNIRRFITQDAVAQSTTRICPKDSILLVSRTGVGKIALAPFEIAVSQDITAFVLDQMKIYPLFGYYAIDMSIHHLIRFNQGTTINGVRQDDLRKLTLKIPSLEEQCAITAVLKACDREIDVLRRYLVELKKLKQGLMQKLLTGQIRIKVGNGESES
jgi:type I restriction enzyme S subunit